MDFYAIHSPIYSKGGSRKDDDESECSRKTSIIDRLVDIHTETISQNVHAQI